MKILKNLKIGTKAYPHDNSYQKCLTNPSIDVNHTLGGYGNGICLRLPKAVMVMSNPMDIEVKGCGDATKTEAMVIVEWDGELYQTLNSFSEIIEEPQELFMFNDMFSEMFSNLMYGEESSNEVKAYKANDGKLFENEGECDDYNSDLNLKELLSDFCEDKRDEIFKTDLPSVLFDNSGELFDILSVFYEESDEKDENNGE